MIFYALIEGKPDLMVCGIWLNLIELEKQFYNGYFRLRIMSTIKWQILLVMGNSLK